MTGKLPRRSRTLIAAVAFFALALASWAQALWWPEIPVPSWVPLTLALLQPLAFAGLRLITQEPLQPLRSRHPPPGPADPDRSPSPSPPT